MIFITVGQMLPFDRLIKAVDLWAGERKNKDMFAQIGVSKYRPKHIKWTDFLSESEFIEHMKKATAVVSHAGTGTMITSLMLHKPILVMPRRAALKETRTDHQYATAKRFNLLNYAYAAFNENELHIKLDELCNKHVLPGHKIGNNASPELLETIKDFIR